MTRHITGVNYATLYLRREADPGPYVTSAALITPEAGGDFGAAALAAVEDDRWILTLCGYGDCRPVADVADMLRRCRDELPEEFGRVAANEPLGDVVTYRQADSRRHDYARAGRLPAGLIAVGDAVASFNPIYGQGISAAALHASCLDLFLREGHDLSRPARCPTGSPAPP